MPVNSTHPDYDASLPAWLRARDVMAGEDAVKYAGEKYLPRLESQTDDEYNAYRARAAFFNASGADGGRVCRLGVPSSAVHQGAGPVERDWEGTDRI